MQSVNLSVFVLLGSVLLIRLVFCACSVSWAAFTKTIGTEWVQTHTEQCIVLVPLYHLNKLGDKIMFAFSPWFQITDHFWSKPSRLIDNHADCKLVYIGSTAIAIDLNCTEFYSVLCFFLLLLWCCWLPVAVCDVSWCACVCCRWPRREVEVFVTVEMLKLGRRVLTVRNTHPQHRAETLRRLAT